MVDMDSAAIEQASNVGNSQLIARVEQAMPATPEVVSTLSAGVATGVVGLASGISNGMRAGASCLSTTNQAVRAS